MPPRTRLIAINAALLGGLVLVTLAGGAQQGNSGIGTGNAAGGGGMQRGPGNYTMVSGRVQGPTADCVFILDAGNQELLALTWNRGNSRFESLGFRKLASDARQEEHGR